MTSTLLPVLTDRSRIECHQKCPRQRFLRYHFNGCGVTRANPLPPAWELLTGSYIHNALEAIIGGVDPLSAAMEQAAAYDKAIAPLFQTVDDEQARNLLEWELLQQMDLVVALTYAWGKRKFPQFNHSYNVVMEDIEREEITDFTVDLGLGAGPQVVRLMTRTDCLSVLRDTSNMLLWNFKSTREANAKWRANFSYDYQTMLEVMAVEARMTAAAPPAVYAEVAGVIIEGLIKGSKTEYPEGSGKWQHNNSLIWAWYKPGDAPEPDQYFPKYRWLDPVEIDAKSGKAKGHQVPKGSYKRLVRESYPGGIPAWIDHLIQVEPEIVDSYFIQLPPILRSAHEMERWKRQVLPVELLIKQQADAINATLAAGDEQGSSDMLDSYFPMHTGSGNCLWPRECEFVKVCHGSDDPMDASRYKPRQCNHLLEAQLFGQKPAGQVELTVEVE